ncbi:MAG: extracellular solute-binding protein [Clostridia bacterium]|nr:extracellular solute-binding protein [Clostridia bacterium]
MKKTLSFMLALLLVLAALPFAVAESADDDPYFGKFDEPVVIKVVESSADEAPNWTWEDNEWTREWKERFNIEIELLWNTGTADDYNTKFSMAMLTGELPDVMTLNSKQFKELFEKGLLADITDVYENNIYPFLMNEIIKAQDESVQEAGVINGRRYAITTSGLGTVSRTYMIRHDYLEEIGAELPTTLEELVELGKEFVDAGLAKYALLLEQKVTGEGYTDMQAVANGYGAYPNIWVRDAEGKLVYSPTTEGMKKALDLYKELYDGGYIQPTFATEVGDNVTAYIKNGEIGILPSDYWVATWPLPLTDENGNVIEFDMVPVLPSEENEDFHMQGTGSMADVSYVCVSAACEHPEAVMRIFNHTCSVNSDPELQDTGRFHTAKLEDGTEISVHMHNPSPVRYWTVPNVNTKTGKAVYDALNGDLAALDANPHYQQQYDNVQKYLAAVEAGDKDGIRASWAMYKLFGGEGSIYMNFYNAVQDGTFIFDARTSKTEDYERLWGSLQQLENTFYVNYIAGTEDTTFEEFVEEWYAAGGRLLTDQLNEE